MSYANAFDVVASEFKKDRIIHVLIGGFAVNHYQVSRHTEDIDFLIAVDDFEAARAALERGGYKLSEKNENFSRFAGPRTDLMSVDLIFVDPETIRKIVETSVKTRVSGHEFRVPALKHLIALKLHAIKNNERRELKDLPDIVSLLEKNKVDVKTKSFRDICLKFGTPELYRRILNFIK